MVGSIFVFRLFFFPVMGLSHFVLYSSLGLIGSKKKKEKKRKKDHSSPPPNDWGGIFSLSASKTFYLAHSVQVHLGQDFTLAPTKTQDQWGQGRDGTGQGTLCPEANQRAPRTRQHGEAGGGQPGQQAEGCSDWTSRTQAQAARHVVDELDVEGSGQQKPQNDPATASTTPLCQILGSANAAMIPQGTQPAAAVRPQQPDTAHKGRMGD